MKRVPLIVLIFIGLIFIPIVLFDNGVYAQGMPDIGAKLSKKADDLWRIRKDFLDFTGSFKDTNPLEYDICYGLKTMADSSYGMADTAAKLIFLHSLITEKKNKELAAWNIMRDLNHYTTSLEDNLDSINRFLTLTQSSAVVSTGRSLKDNMQELKQLLESVKLP